MRGIETVATLTYFPTLKTSKTKDIKNITGDYGKQLINVKYSEALKR